MSKAKWCLHSSIVILTLIGGFFIGMFNGQTLIAPLVKLIIPPPAGVEYSKFTTQKLNNRKVIVFVHGVTGSATGTWVNTRAGVDTHWPDLIKDDKRLREYDVFATSYFTPQVATGPNIAQIANVVHQDLVRHQILPDVSGQSRYNEVIFICHSMGNLIIRNMMVMYPLPPPEKSNIQIPLILSLASPSAGSRLVEYVEKFSQNPTFKEMADLGKNSFLQLLNEVWMKTAFDTEIACAYEELPLGEFGIIVEKESATAVCTRKDYHGFKEDHISIAKPSSDIHPVHKWAVEQILQKRVARAWELPRWTEKEIIIGGKDYPASNLHAAIIALALRSDPKLRELSLQIKTQYHMGHASRVFSSLVNRRIDIYPEYDGSLLHEYLRNPLPGDPTATGVSPPKQSHSTEEVNLELKKNSLTLKIKYLPHFGYNDPYVLVMSHAKAKELGILKEKGTVSMSDVASQSKNNLILIADQEWFYRNEWSALQERYKMKFNGTKEIAHPFLFDYVKKGEPGNKGVVAVAFGSDPQLNVGDTNLVKIEDDKGVLPDYHPAPLVDELLLKLYPEIETALKNLDGIMCTTDVINLLMDYEKRLRKVKDKSDAVQQEILESIAREFLMRKNVIPE